MQISCFDKNCCYAAVLAVLSVETCRLLYRIYKNKKEKKKKLHASNGFKSYFCKVLFFPDKQVPCFNYLLTAQELAEAISIKHRLGAKVRVIADTEYMNMSGSKIPSFMKEGIAVRHDRSSYLMHHKFVIIDGNVVITGSFNWTHAAVIGNYENIIATDSVDVVRPYATEFERLWTLFDAEHGPCRDVSAAAELLGKSDMYHMRGVGLKREM